MNEKSFEEYIKSGNCFKLILGAGNEEIDAITKFVYIYALAGCKFFDVSASINAILSAKEGLKKAGKEGCICASIGTKDDPHMSKCKIDTSKCTVCIRCLQGCQEGAIVFCGDTLKINDAKCIGCQKCMKFCREGAIQTYQKEVDFEENFNEIKDYTDCIEFHITTSNKDEIYNKWEFLSKNYNGYLSIALNRVSFSNNDIKDILSEMFKIRQEKVMIQADGSPMSGGCDDYNTTLQAVATADIIRKLGFNAPILVSGGTNSKTAELLNMCNIDAQGIAIGSWARKQVREYVNKDYFWESKEVISKATDIAGNIVGLSQVF